FTSRFWFVHIVSTSPYTTLFRSRLRAEVLLLGRSRDGYGRGGIQQGGEGDHREHHLRRGQVETAVRPEDREDAREARIPDRPPHRNQVSRAAQYPRGSPPEGDRAQLTAAPEPQPDFTAPGLYSLTTPDRGVMFSPWVRRVFPVCRCRAAA